VSFATAELRERLGQGQIEDAANTLQRFAAKVDVVPSAESEMADLLDAGRAAETPNVAALG
jgi:hypothetical protein